MQKEGYRRSTIESAVSGLKGVARKADLLDPEAVKRYLGIADLTEGRKEALTVRLARFYKYKGISWTAPRYRRVEKLPFIPLESEVEQLRRRRKQPSKNLSTHRRIRISKVGENAWLLKNMLLS